MMVPAVRQEIRIKAVIVVFEHAAASQATWSSKNRVRAAPWRARGTAAATAPCSGQATRGAAASSSARTVHGDRQLPLPGTVAGVFLVPVHALDHRVFAAGHRGP